ncbi:MAG: diguanylate cyclase [Phormidium sp. GEM2.Bin31]|nr:MAG: diguanylate cyclase [Phormidium sp. GEM2.Bin31]
MVPPRCTLSLGVITATQSKVTLNDLLKPADLALYEAKNSGQNQAQYIVFSR